MTVVDSYYGSNAVDSIVLEEKAELRMKRGADEKGSGYEIGSSYLNTNYVTLGEDTVFDVKACERDVFQGGTLDIGKVRYVNLENTLGDWNDQVMGMPVKSYLMTRPSQVIWRGQDLYVWEMYNNSKSHDYMWENIAGQIAFESADTNSMDVNTSFKSINKRRISNQAAIDFDLKVNPITDTDKVVTGTVVPGALVRLYVYEADHYEYHESVAREDGSYSIPVDNLIGSEYIYVMAEKNKQYASDNWKVEQTVKLKKPYIDENTTMITDSPYILGKAEPKNTLVVTVEGLLEPIIARTSSGSGIFEIDASKFPENAKVSVVAKDNDGNESAPTTFYVRNYFLSIDEADFKDTLNISGTFGSNINKLGLWVDGKLVKEIMTKLSDKNQYSFSLEGIEGIRNGTKVEVVGTDTKQNQVVNKKSVSAKDYRVIIDAFALGDTTITGQLGTELSIVNFFVNGRSMGAGRVSTDKDFIIPIVDPEKIKATDNIEIVAKNKRGEIVRKSVEMLNYQLKSNKYAAGESILSGTYGKDVSNIQVWVNDKMIGRATLNAENNFSFPNADKLISLNDKVELLAFDDEETERSRTMVSILDYSLLSIKEYRIGESQIIGSYGKDVFQVRLVVNGEIVQQAQKYDTNKTFVFSKVDQLIHYGDTVEVIAVDSSYRRANQSRILLKDYSLNLDSYVGGQTSLSGLSGKDVYKIRLWVNNQVVQQAQKDEDGQFTFINANRLIQKGDTVEILAVDSSYRVVNRLNLKPTFPNDYSLTAENYELGEKRLTGTYGKDVYRVRLWVNGQPVMQGEISDQGKFVFPTAQNLIKRGDKVELVAVDARYAEVNRIMISVSIPKDYSLTVNTYELGQATLSGQFGNDIRFVRLWVNGVPVTQGEVRTTGEFIFPTAKSLINNGDKVELVAVDDRYKEVNRIAVSVGMPKDYTLMSDTYRAGQAALTGRFGIDIAYIRLWVNGKVVTQAEIVNKGIFKFPSAGRLIRSGDKVELVAVDNRYREVKRVKVIF
ncbi:immunoglobulin-like domain-containing protein [Listeria floridensis]|nr:immunoglobulin-like domain-containing protein [Listeria floridensis]